MDEIISKQTSSNSQIQSAVDTSGHIRVTRTKNKAKMPSKEYRKTMLVEMYSWLCMASRYRSKHWLHGLTADPFVKFVEYILGERVLNIQLPAAVHKTLHRGSSLIGPQSWLTNSNSGKRP